MSDACTTKANRLRQSIVAQIIGLIEPTQEWTTLRVADLLQRFGPDAGHRRETVREALALLFRQHAGFVVEIATCSAMATWGEGGRRAKVLARDYWHFGGRYISHIRLHRDARGASCRDLLV